MSARLLLVSAGLGVLGISLLVPGPVHAQSVQGNELAEVQRRIESAYEQMKRRSTVFEVRGLYDEVVPFFPPGQEFDEADYQPLKRRYSWTGRTYVDGARYAYEVSEHYEDLSEAGEPRAAHDVSRSHFDDDRHLYWLDVSSEESDPCIIRTSDAEGRRNGRAKCPDHVLDGFIWGDTAPWFELAGKPGSDVSCVLKPSADGMSDEYVLTHEDGAAVRTVVIDPQHGFLPKLIVREKEADDKRWRYRCDVTRFQRNEGVWVPAEYTYRLERMSKSGSTESVDEAHVVLDSVQWTYDSEGGRVFEPRFPHGMDVLDLELANAVNDFTWDAQTQSIKVSVEQKVLDEMANVAENAAVVPEGQPEAGRNGLVEDAKKAGKTQQGALLILAVSAAVLAVAFAVMLRWHSKG